MRALLTHAHPASEIVSARSSPSCQVLHILGDKYRLRSLRFRFKPHWPTLSPGERGQPPPACSLVKSPKEERDCGRDPGTQQAAQTLAPLLSPWGSPTSFRAPIDRGGIGVQS